MVGGCHNGQFDVTMMNIIRGIRDEGLHYFGAEPETLVNFGIMNGFPTVGLGG